MVNEPTQQSSTNKEVRKGKRIISALEDFLKNKNNKKKTYLIGNKTISNDPTIIIFSVIIFL